VNVGDLIRHRAARAGFDLGHVPDDELGARLVAMPLDLSDSPDGVRSWLVYGTVDGPSDEGRANGSGPPRPSRPTRERTRR